MIRCHGQSPKRCVRISYLHRDEHRRGRRRSSCFNGIEHAPLSRSGAPPPRGSHLPAQPPQGSASVGGLFHFQPRHRHWPRAALKFGRRNVPRPPRRRMGDRPRGLPSTTQNTSADRPTDLRDDVSAFYISGEPPLFTSMTRVMPLIAASGKPTVGTYPEWGRAGLLMSYSNDLVSGIRHAGTYVAKSLLAPGPAIFRLSRRASLRS
jgi:hypothetical protein